ncbi:hypothetical protein FD754_012191 [Muntiacus muntjak]|uniref:Ankyrin repeat domain 33B n=1 Tax=Muntiacus muntjak TaxID=9888 RepID=A0A5N3VE25_MUNMU|nr:hypothetical protein FD754_012191 [Muntiacus muntjak]
MVLLAGPGPEGGGARRVSPEPPSPPRDAQAGEDPADYEEYEDFSSLPDTRSIASDDSFYPYGDEEEYSSVSAESAPEAVPEGVPEAATLLRAACANDVGLLRALVRRGPSAEEVQETDRNGRTDRRVTAAARCPGVGAQPTVTAVSLAVTSGVASSGLSAPLCLSFSAVMWCSPQLHMLGY